MTPLQRMRASRRTFETHESRVDGCRVLARRSTVAARNDAPTVLLIGATALSGRYLRPVGVEMAGRYPVWVPDLPGRGASESPKKVLSVEENADLLAAWMEVAGIRDTVAPSGWAQRMADLIPDGRLREVPGASHSMVYSNALELARVSDGFLQHAVLRGGPRPGSASGAPDGT